MSFEPTRMFLEFTTNSALIRDIYKDDPFIYRIEYDFGNDGKTGYAFKNRKEDYPRENFVTVDLTEDEFYEYYLKQKYNPNYDSVDLRLVFYLNRYNDMYNVKFVRNTCYYFSAGKICAYYHYPDMEALHFKIACVNEGVLSKNDKFYCPEHINV